MAEDSIITDARTSLRMARIRQKGTAAELVVRAALRSLGVAYRLNVKSLPGSPDIANQRRRFAILVQGCFWHHHRSCKRATVPKRNELFWRSKFTSNRKRDAHAILALRRLGYRVAVVWECEAFNPERLRDRLTRVLSSKVREPCRVNVR